MRILHTGLRYILCCITAAISSQAAFVPTSPSSIIQHTKCNHKNNVLFSTNTKPNSVSTSPLSTLQDALPDLNIEKLNPIRKTAVPSPPTPPPFDPTNPEALIAITKSFIATDFGIQSSQLPSYSTAPKKKSSDQDDESSSPASLPFYSSSLLSNDFIWISSNNLNDGRAGILNKAEYLAAGRYFNLRKSFPDLEYRAHDFRVIVNESQMYNDVDGTADRSVEEITVRFTTLAVGTFRGLPFRLRSKILEPNGKVMRCPPTSVSITYATRGENAGKIIKLVNDMVMDRGFGNTMGLSGIAGAAVIAGAAPSDWEVYPPLVSAGRIFGRPIKMIQERDEDEGYLPPFPDSVMIQLAKGVTATNFGLEDSDLLSEDFTYIEPLMGPMDKERYIAVFDEFNVKNAVPDLDYQFQNYRIDPYDPYRVWIDTRARGTRTGPIGKSAPPNPSKYLAPPESISLTFDNDGFCTRITAAAPLDPLLGNTGLLGGVYGLLYATETPENPLKTRTFNLLLNRAQKVALKAITKAGIDEYRLSDGRIISGNKPVAQLPASSSISASSESLPNPPKLPIPPAKETAPKTQTPFFAAPKANPTIPLPTKQSQSDSPKSQPRPKAATVALPKPAPATTIQVEETKPIPSQPEQVKTVPSQSKVISENPQDPVTDAFSSFFGTSEVTNTQSTTKPVEKEIMPATSTNKVEELRKAAAEARKEAADAKQRAAEQRALMEENNATPPQAAQTTSASPKRSPTLNIFAAKQTIKGSVSSPSTPAQRSPTFSIFSSTPSETKGSLTKPQPQSPPSTPKKSPTLSLFGSPVSSSEKAPAPTPQKKTPTLSLFGSSPNTPGPKASVPPKPAKKAVAKGATKKSQTFSIAGVGGSPPKVTTKQSKGKVAQKKTGVKEVVKNASAKKGTNKTPTFALFQGPTSSAPVKKEVTKSEATKSPTLSLFGTKPSTSTPSKNVDTKGKREASKSEATKSPTFSLFGTKASASTPSKNVDTEQPVASKSSSFPLFSGGQKTKPAPVQKTSTELKPKQTATTTSSDSKSSSGSSLFGGFFGGSSSAGKVTPNESNSQPTKNSTPSKAQPASTDGVPTLKQWKVNSDNSIEARIYGSSSFKDGATVTTSPIGKKFKIAKGNVIQTSSGSKYLLS